MDGDVEMEYMEEERNVSPQPPPAAASSPTSQAPVHPPLVHIQFYDNDHSQGIYQLIEAYMLSLQSDPLAGDLRQQVEAVSRDVVENEGEAKEDGESTMMETTPPTSPTHTSQEEEREPPGHVEYYREFCVDRYAISYKTQVLFDQVYSEPFWVDPFVAREERRLRRMAIKCFNCGEDHHLSQCPEPKDVQRILNQSRLFKESLGTFGTDKRYHLCSSTERFSKFCPGRLSARLRQALGIGPSSLPPYISRMCVLGYPPGYSIQEKEQGLFLYDSPDSPDTGEASETKSRVIFPGFNDKPAPAKVQDKPGKVVGKPGNVADKTPLNKDRKTKSKEKKGVGGSTKKKTRASDLEDDLGTLSDYELEEVDGEDGEMVIGFCVHKRAEEKTDSSPDCTATKTKNFSLDFPPGLVDIEAASGPSSQAWNSIQNVLSRKS